MARVARKMRRFISFKTAASKYLLLIVIVCAIKLIFLVPILLFVTRSSQTHYTATTITTAISPESSVDTRIITRLSDFSWRPQPDMVMRVLGELNMTAEEGQRNLPLTLNSRFLLNNESICGKGHSDPVDTLFLVHTAPDNYHRRLLMRNTIAAEEFFRPFMVRVVFLLGRVANSSLQKALEMEHMVYGDTVQGDFLDSYRNLSHKGVLGFRWVSQYCPQVRHVVKIDDDVFFDTYKMLLRYRGLFQGRKRAIFCNLLLRRSMPIYREESNKWVVEEQQFAGMDTFPYDYCSGLAVVLSGDMVPALFHAAFFTPVFWIDDIYLFGILPAIAGDVTMLHLGYKDRYVNMKTKSALTCMQRRQYRCSVLATMCYTTEEWETMWNLTYHLHLDTNWGLPYVKLRASNQLF